MSILSLHMMVEEMRRSSDLDIRKYNPPSCHLFGLLSQNVTNRVTYKKWKFISHSSEDWEKQAQGAADAVVWRLMGTCFSLHPHTIVEKPIAPFLWVWKPLVRMEASKPNHLPSSPPFHTICVGRRLKVQSMKCRVESTNIFTIAPTNREILNQREDD